MNPQDRPARRFDEPPAYEDLEKYVPEEERRELTPAMDRRITPEYVAYLRDIGASDELVAFAASQIRRDPDIAARSHLGAIVIVAAVVVLVVIAAALFLRGAS